MNQQLITAVTAMAPSFLTLAWRSGKQTRVDVLDYFNVSGYKRLQNTAFFATATVEEWGHGVEWANGEIGIDADALYRLGKEQTGLAFPTHEFNAWLERNELSLAAAARALGITRRTIIYYHGGYKPIPLYIKLACIGWETVTLQKAA